MAHSICAVAYGLLLDNGADVVYLDIVRMVKVVAQVVFGKVEWYEEACVIRRQSWGSDQSYSKFGAAKVLVEDTRCVSLVDLQEDLLAAEGYYFLANLCRIHDGRLGQWPPGSMAFRRKAEIAWGIRQRAKLRNDFARCIVGWVEWID